MTQSSASAGCVASVSRVSEKTRVSTAVWLLWPRMRGLGVGVGGRGALV